MKQLKDLNLMDRFLFDHVMEDSQTCQDILSICLGIDIPKLKEIQSERSLELSPELRAVRLDVVSLDEEDTVYNTEMQGYNTQNLPRRSRLYQAHIDVSLLPPGEFNFNKLNDSYMVMIMPFDLFGEGRYRYTFQNRCEEDKDIVLGDGAVKIYLNTEGRNEDEVNTELVKFLELVKDSDMYIEDNPENERLIRIQKRIKQVKQSEEIGVSYMTAWEEKMYERMEGREEGRAEGRAEGRVEGMKEGRTAALQEAQQEMIRLLIQSSMEENLSEEKIADKLKRFCNLSEAEVLAHMEKYKL